MYRDAEGNVRAHTFERTPLADGTIFVSRRGLDTGGEATVATRQSRIVYPDGPAGENASGGDDRGEGGS